MGVTTGTGVLLLVRNGVDHDARVLRAARVAERTLGARALILGSATTTSPAGSATLQGIAVVRVPAYPPGLLALARRLTRGGRRGGTPTRAPATPRDSTVSAPPAQATQHPPATGAAPATPATSRMGPAARARRIAAGLFYALQAVRLARRVRPELVQANDWNTMWAGLLIKAACRSRLVYDSHELWADRNGRWERRSWLLACEALFVRLSDRVLTSSPGYAAAIGARYHVAQPAVVRNIPEGCSVSPVLCPSDLRARLERPIVAYVGGLMPGRGLEQMIDALGLLADVRLRATGPGAGAYRAQLLSRAQRVGVSDRVELCDPVAPSEVASLFGEAAAGLCLIQPICRSYELCLPNKLFEYASAGIPVLASDLPVLGAVVRREGFGVLAAPDDTDAIAASLRRLLDPGRWLPAARRAHEFALANDWRAEADTLAALYRIGAVASPR